MVVKAGDSSGFFTSVNENKGIIYAADSGADILSNSWGGPDSNLKEEAIDYAYNIGCVIIASSGNDGNEIPSYPAAYEEVIAVGSLERKVLWGVKRADSSNYGNYLDLMAPGVDILSTMQTYHVTLNNAPWYHEKNYDYMDGTSI